MLRALLVSIVIGAGSPVFAGAEPPPVFARLTVDEARAKSASEKKLLLIKATAEWCSPCKQMDKTTFRDEKVVAWLNQNAVAVELDVDKQPELAKKLKVRAMPTMILSRGDQELDRAMGYRDGPSLLKWLEAANGGTRARSTR